MDTIDSAILDAARQIILEVGLRSTKMAAVARKAGISRPTLYARYANLDLLSRAVLTKEIESLHDGLPLAVSTIDDLCDLLVTIADRARQTPLLQSLLRNDTDIIAEYQWRRMGRSQTQLISILAEQLRELRRQGELTTQESSQTIATFIQHLIQSSVLSYQALEPPISDATTWAQNLRAMVKGYLTQQ